MSVPRRSGSSLRSSGPRLSETMANVKRLREFEKMLLKGTTVRHSAEKFRVCRNTVRGMIRELRRMGSDVKHGPEHGFWKSTRRVFEE